MRRAPEKLNTELYRRRPCSLQRLLQSGRHGHRQHRDALVQQRLRLLGRRLAADPAHLALYRALMSSIELRHAPFMLWIHDLAAKDPYYVTPIIMGATMFIQQKMTPSAGMDPTQAKMMMMLPVVFTVMFINMPAGLVLYWLVNNILTIAQQAYINKSLQS